MKLAKKKASFGRPSSAEGPPTLNARSAEDTDDEDECCEDAQRTTPRSRTAGPKITGESDNEMEEDDDGSGAHVPESEEEDEDMEEEVGNPHLKGALMRGQLRSQKAQIDKLKMALRLAQNTEANNDGGKPWHTKKKGRHKKFMLGCRLETCCHSVLQCVCR